MNEAMIQTRVLQDAMKAWRNKNKESESPSSTDEADVKSEEDFFRSVVKKNKNQKDSLFHVRKKKMTDREMFDSFFLSDDQLEDNDD